MVGQFPLGGVAWDYFHYLLGLHELGHDVYYHEDTWVWPYDPLQRSPVDQPDYTLKFLRDFFDAYAPQLAQKWHYVFLHEKHFGLSAAQFAEVARTADIFLNVSGACFIPQELGPRCVKVFLDTDPGYNQMMLQHKFAWSQNVQRWCAAVAEHDRHFTYAENLYGQDCTIPRGPFDWRTTRCVVSLPAWSKVRATALPADAPMTTIMTWDYFQGRVIHEGVEYRTKLHEFERFSHLPQRTNLQLALAVGGTKAPLGRLQRQGWRILDAQASTLTPQAYQELIGRSAGEWSVAKQIYVATRSGWFSCRTACYLAAGRPAVVQETGWSKFIPSGRGVIAFETLQQILDGLAEVAANAAAHRAAAYEIAREYLAPDRVLVKMIEAI